jgi:uncharacterized membrane protein YdcZ (DUF606 family)
MSENKSLYSIGGIACNFVSTVLSEEAGIVRGIIALILIPLVITGSLLYFGVQINNEIIKSVISAVAILVGFSLNALLLLLRYSKESDSSDKLMRIVRHISTYTILIGIFTVSFCLVSLLLLNNFSCDYMVKAISAIIYLLTSHYLLSVLLLPARVFVFVEMAEDNNTSTQ